MSTVGYRQRDVRQLNLGRTTAHVAPDIYEVFRAQKEACRQRMDQDELTNEQFLQVLLDVHALHLDADQEDTKT